MIEFMVCKKVKFDVGVVATFEKKFICILFIRYTI